MSYHFGDAVIDAFKIHWGIGTCAFRPETIEYPGPRHLRLLYDDPGWPHLAHFRPEGQWGPRQMPGGVKAQVGLTYGAEGSFQLHVQVSGLVDMPINLQLLLRENGKLTAPDGEMIALNAGGRTLTHGQGDYVLHGPSGRRIRIEGLPPGEHRLELGESRAIMGRAEQRCHRLIAALFTPVDLHLRITPLDLG